MYINYKGHVNSPNHLTSSEAEETIVVISAEDYEKAQQEAFEKQIEELESLGSPEEQEFQRKRETWRRQYLIDTTRYQYRLELREKFYKLREKLEAKLNARIAEIQAARPEDLWERF